MTRRLLLSTSGALFVALLLGQAPALAQTAGADLSTRMGALVAGLDESQRERASYAFDDDERFDLKLAPILLEGLRRDEMTDAQTRALDDALRTILSPSGLAKVDTIRSLETEVAELEGGWFGFLFDRLRETGRYFLAVFGEPAEDRAWGMRLDGHHLSLNWTVAPGAPVSVTPLFLGGQPREVPAPLERAGLRPLPEEEDRAVAFVAGLSAEQRAVARLPWGGGGALRRPMFVSGGVPLEVAEPAGLLRAGLPEDAQARLDAILEVVLANFVPEIAEGWRQRFADGADAIHFAFAVPEDLDQAVVGRSLYYRIQGADFLLEFDNTSPAADHIHVVWRDLRGDYGRDVLGEHLAAHP